MRNNLKNAQIHGNVEFGDKRLFLNRNYLEKKRLFLEGALLRKSACFESAL
jgi:hypothetical protein